MRKLLVFSCLAPSLVALGGCASTSSFVHSDATLGRVVVYRNGIAYFERNARIEGDSLRLAVPEDKVDDFLKSLTVVDAKTGEPAPIAYPTSAPSSESGLIDMKINLTGPTSHDLRLSYVTEAPSWKPSYRVVVGKDGKVNVQAWAIVDNTSGEDWQDVQLGVGSSSALSFRFDLRSVRLVQRETLHQDDLFAQAPPMGGAAYNQLVNQAGGPAGRGSAWRSISRTRRSRRASPTAGGRSPPFEDGPSADRAIGGADDQVTQDAPPPPGGRRQAALGGQIRGVNEAAGSIGAGKARPQAPSRRRRRRTSSRSRPGPSRPARRAT